MRFIAPLMLVIFALPALGAEPAKGAANKDTRPSVIVVPFVRVGNVSPLVAARVQEAVKGRLDFGGSLKLRTESDRTAPEPRQVSRTPVLPPTKGSKEIEEADRLRLEAGDLIADGKCAVAAGKLATALKKFESNQIEIVDFNPWIDTLGKAATCEIDAGRTKQARAYLRRALMMQPTFVVDLRSASKPLVEALTAERDALESKPKSKLTVACSAPRASVFLDGVSFGGCGATREGVPAGSHIVQVRADGFKPFGKRVDANKGKPIALEAKLASLATTRDKEDNEPQGPVHTKDLGAFAQKGDFASKAFKSRAALLGKQTGADNVVFGVVADLRGGVMLHLFAWHIPESKLLAVDPLAYAKGADDVNRRTDGIDAIVAKVLLDRPRDRIVRGVPAVFKRK